MVHIEALRLGETTAHQMTACALDLEPLRSLPGFEAQGLLGLNFLKAFRVTIDFEREMLRLEPV